MTEQELIGLLCEEFYADFAVTMAQRVRDADALGLLYATATSRHEELPREVRHKVLFRSAYVLEVIYLDAPASFRPFAESFCACDFAACTDESTKRHFGKIMTHLLREYDPGIAALGTIAETAAQWAVEPRTKVAVRIWAVEILKYCRQRVDWVAESWEDLLEAIAQDATPGICCRLRKSWRAE